LKSKHSSIKLSPAVMYKLEQMMIPMQWQYNFTHPGVHWWSPRLR